ncbi:UbiA prenyltransferase [Candidatus Caldarchaeum subterraneum]|uniref:Prenyltransferase n=1 Tax=Caldiarchaeum subterraneum TaxID=311458 RepID=E6N3I5_CALS0|nr:prenyltransferase [Candidatus Caldarchaeum subterraneum]BAJ50444.1 UbiA prenyltransferase [Candidatus Caldarchaeum subterraneum]
MALEAVQKVLKVSRFRFWIYVAGPYVVGYTLGATGFSDFLRPEYYIYLIYFFIPANILVYGVNDYFDVETDALNPKKSSKELRIVGRDRVRLRRLLLGVLGISFALMLFQDNVARILFGGFLFLSIFYSAPPLRFKSKPFLDFASNYLYIMPGVFGHYIASGSLPDTLILLAGFLHISAMHIFSAVPDIEFDLAAGIKTTPVVIGRKNALILVTVFWAGLAYLAIMLTGFHPLSFLALIYPMVPLSVLVFGRDINRVYWSLPYINTSLGGLLWLGLVNHKIIPFFPNF